MKRITEILPEIIINKYRTMWKHEDEFVTFSTTEEMDLALNMINGKKPFTVWCEAKVFRGKKKNKKFNRRRERASPGDSVDENKNQE